MEMMLFEHFELSKHISAIQGSRHLAPYIKLRAGNKTATQKSLLFAYSP